MKILLIGNAVNKTGNYGGYSGMEESFSDYLKIISKHYECFPDIQFYAPCFDDSLPIFPNMTYFNLPVNREACPSEYVTYGDGKSKWEHLLNDKNIFSIIMSCVSEIDLIHDQSSSTLPALLGSHLKIPVIKTIRLPNFHPSASLVWDCLAGKIFLSKSQVKFYSRPRIGLHEVISDYYIPVFSSRTISKSNRLICVGRVESRKGISAAVTTAVKLGKEIDFVGEVIDSRLANEICNRFGGRVSFLGPKPITEVHTLIEKSEALVWIPDFPEPGGRVVIEALKLGTNVYAKTIGYAQDIHDTITCVRRRAANQENIRELGCVYLEPTDLKIEDDDGYSYFDRHINFYKKCKLGGGCGS